MNRSIADLRNEPIQVKLMEERWGRALGQQLGQVRTLSTQPSSIPKLVYNKKNEQYILNKKKI